MELSLKWLNLQVCVYRFSGVSEKDVRGTNVCLKDIQNTLLKLISSDTILIGYELENDLCALKVSVYIH